MKGGPFFCQDILNKRLQDRAELLADGELESACLASSQRKVAVLARAPGALIVGPVLMVYRAQRHLSWKDKARLSFTVAWATQAWRSDQAGIQETG